MAVIKFKADQQQSLSGTLCGMIYRTRNGKTSVFTEPVPFMPKRPTEAQRLKYHKDCVVQDCTRQIQSLILARTDRSVAEMQRVADMHYNIRKTIFRWYDFYRQYFHSDSDLTKALVYYFRCKHLPPELLFQIEQAGVSDLPDGMFLPDLVEGKSEESREQTDTKP